jgi:hypothetical protein
MNHLTPEKRLDRNGRWVTKHVRDASLPSRSGSIPTPTVHHYDKTTAVEHFKSVMDERGAGSGDLKGITAGLRRVNEETRIIVMTALEENTDLRATYSLCFALQTNDEQFIRSASISAEFIADYLAAVLRRERDGSLSPANNALALLRDMHRSHRQMVLGGEFEVSDYDSERDQSIAAAFKAQCLAEHLDLEKKLPAKFEYYRHFNTLVDNMEFIEDAVHGIVDVTTACRHWAAQNGKRSGSVSFDTNDALAIAEIVRDYPNADDLLYDIIVERGKFDPETVRLSLSEDTAPSLARGVL